jgi:hypothetical protein
MAQGISTIVECTSSSFMLVEEVKIKFISNDVMPAKGIFL